MCDMHGRTIPGKPYTMHMTGVIHIAVDERIERKQDLTAISLHIPDAKAYGCCCVLVTSQKVPDQDLNSVAWQLQSMPLSLLH